MGPLIILRVIENAVLRSKALGSREAAFYKIIRTR